MSNRALKCFTAGLVIYSAIALYGHARELMETDSTDQSKKQRSGLKLHTDYGTGCQYLAAVRGGLFPRIAADGVGHVGCGEGGRQ